jgi:hypothetical protein
MDDYYLGNKTPPPAGIGSAHIGNSTGWSCPKCGAVMSPTTPMCFYCVPKKPAQEETQTGGPECLTE